MAEITLPERLGISEAATERLTEYEILMRLVEAGSTRLSAERILERERDGGEGGRARRRPWAGRRGT